MPSKDVCGLMHTRSLLNGVVNITVWQALSARHVCPNLLLGQRPVQDTASLIGGGNTPCTHCKQ